MKKLFIILFVLFVISGYSQDIYVPGGPGTTMVLGPITPTSPLDTYPASLHEYIQGGMMLVQDIAARNAITPERRRIGQLAYVIGETRFYQLVGGITNSDWQIAYFYVTGPVADGAVTLATGDQIFDYMNPYVISFNERIAADSLNMLTITSALETRIVNDSLLLISETEDRFTSDTILSNRITADSILIRSLLHDSLILGDAVGLIINNQVLSLVDTFVIPTQTDTALWNSGGAGEIQSLNFYGTTNKLLSLTKLNGDTVSGSFTDLVDDADSSISNEGALTASSGSGSAIITSNTDGSTPITIKAGGINTISRTGNEITITATEVDPSITNELQKIDSFALVGNTLQLSLEKDYEALKEVDLSSLANVATNIAEGTATETTVPITSSTGTGATLLAASTIRAGVLTKEKFDEIVANTAKTSNATHTGDVTGSTELTIANDSVNDLHINWGTGTNQVSTADVPEQTNLYYTDARSRLAISETVPGLTYTNTTGVLSLDAGYEIPQVGSGYVPYTGATSSLNIGNHNLILGANNTSWLQGIDYAGNVANLLKLSQDNLIEFGKPVAISSLYHLANQELTDIVNIPTNSDAVSGDTMGVGISIGDTRILSVTGIADGTGGLINDEGNINVKGNIIADNTISSDSIVANYFRLPTGATDGYVLQSDASGNGIWTNLAAGITYKGSWDANTNTPTLTDASGSLGWMYSISVTGTRDLGVGGSITWTQGGFAIHNGTKYEFIGNDANVTSVNTYTGAVTLYPQLTGNLINIRGNTTTIDISSSTAVAANSSKVSNVSTSLSAGTVTATTYGITSDGSTNDIVLPEANATQAGLLGADKWNEIVANTAKVSDINHNVTTNLDTASTATTYTIISSDGTDATIASANGTRAGILTSADWNAIALNTAKETNVSTNLSEGATTNTTVVIESSDGTDATLQPASTSRAGLLTKALYDNIITNNGKNTNISTDLYIGSRWADSLGVSSDGSTDDVVLPPASNTQAGLLTATLYGDIQNNNDKNTMVYPSSDGIAIKSGTGWGTSITDNSSSWIAGFNDKINSLAFSGTTTKTLTLTQQDGGTVSNTFTDLVNDADASTTNELQTLSTTSDATSNTVTLSNSGGSLKLIEGEGIDFATTGTSLNGIVTITNTGIATFNETRPNNTWIKSFNYAGDTSNLFKLSKDNVIEAGHPLAISSLYHVANQELADIVNIPVNGDSNSGDTIGVGITVGDTRILEASGIADGTGGLLAPRVKVTGINPTNIAFGFVPYQSGSLLENSPMYFDGDNAYTTGTFNINNSAPLEYAYSNPAFKIDAGGGVELKMDGFGNIQSADAGDYKDINLNPFGGNVNVGSSGYGYSNLIATGTVRGLYLDATNFTTNTIPYDNGSYLASSNLSIGAGLIKSTDAFKIEDNSSVSLLPTISSAFTVSDAANWFIFKIDAQGKLQATEDGTGSSIYLNPLGGNVNIGTTTTPPGATKALTIADGTAPSVGVNNQASLYSMGGDLYVKNSAGIQTKLSGTTITQTYLGTWNASTNSPAISNGTGTAGTWRRCVIAGTWNAIDFYVGDDVYYNGSVWQRIPAGTTPTLDAVTSIGASTDNTIEVGGLLVSGYTATFNRPVTFQEGLQSYAEVVNDNDVLVKRWYYDRQKVQTTFSGTSLTFNGENGSDGVISLSGNTTLTFTNLIEGAKGNLYITNNGYTLTIAGYDVEIPIGSLLSGDTVALSGVGKKDLLVYWYTGTKLIIGLAKDLR